MINRLKLALLILATGALSFALGITISAAFADQDYMPAGQSANYARSCSFEGKTAQTVSVTSTAATSTAPGVGVVRLYCTQGAHFVQWLSGVTGATATVSSTPVAAATPEYILSAGGKFSIIRDTADGTCFLTECK